MSHFDRSLRSQFFLTGPRPCPYLPGRKERKLFTNLAGPEAAALHDELSLNGFRRSQNIAYRPACSGCNACYSTRVCANDFEASRTQRRIIKRNADIQRAILEPSASDEQYELFQRYLGDRHSDGGMTDMDAFDFAAMIEDSAVRTRLIEYRLPPEDPESTRPGRLIGACLPGCQRVFHHRRPGQHVAGHRNLFADEVSAPRGAAFASASAAQPPNSQVWMPAFSDWG